MSAAAGMVVTDPSIDLFPDWGELVEAGTPDLSFVGGGREARGDGLKEDRASLIDAELEPPARRLARIRREVIEVFARLRPTR